MRRCAYPPIPSFAPEHFGVVRCKDAGKYKQFRRGIDQLDTEGVVQVLSSDLRGDQAPVLAAVGPLQFDVVLHRLEHEFGAKSELSHLDYEIARLTDEAGIEALKGARGAEVLTRRLDGALLALFADKWRLNAIQRDNPSLRLDPLLAGTADVAARPASGTIDSTGPGTPRSLLHPGEVDLVEVAVAVGDAAAARPLPHQRVLARRGLPAEELGARRRAAQAPAGRRGRQARGRRQ